MTQGQVSFAVRAGYNQGYFTHGFELNPFIFARGLNIQYAVYTSETGDEPGDSPDKRRVLQVNFDFENEHNAIKSVCFF